MKSFDDIFLMFKLDSVIIYLHDFQRQTNIDRYVFQNVTLLVFKFKFDFNEVKFQNVTILSSRPDLYAQIQYPN